MACSICLEEVASDAHRLECGHAFHAPCLIRWLRQGNLSCPNCRDGLRLEDNVPTFHLRERARYIRRTIARRKRAPPELLRIVAALQCAERKQREARREHREHGAQHRDILARQTTLRIRKWTAARRVMECERLLGLFDCPELTLPALRVGSSPRR